MAVLNWSGTLATLVALVRPRTLRPDLVVPSIAALDWARLAHHVDAVVVDKDNCLAEPNHDCLADDPALRASWAALLAEFGPRRVLVVSNSAGDLRKDPLLLQAEAVSRNLRVPVLAHPAPKPAYACARQIAAHFLDSDAPAAVVYSPLARARERARPPPPSSKTREATTTTATTTAAPLRVLVIGDRLATDMILAHRLASLSLPLSVPTHPSTSTSPSSWFPLLTRKRQQLGHHGRRIETVAVLTTHLWRREGPGTTALRLVENWAVRAHLRQRQQQQQQQHNRHDNADESGRSQIDWRQFTRPGVQHGTSSSSSWSWSAASATPSSSTITTKEVVASPSWNTALRDRLRVPDHPANDSSPAPTPSTTPSSWVHSIPTLIHDGTARVFRALLNAVERNSPRWIALLEKGSKQLKQVYYPAPPEPERSPSSPPSVVGRVIERGVDMVEQQWAEAGRTLDRFRYRYKGATAAVDGTALLRRQHDDQITDSRQDGKVRDGGPP